MGRGLELAAALLATSLLLAATPAIANTDEPLVKQEVHPEDRLSEALAAMRDGHYALASQRLEPLLSIEPNFRLAQLLYGQVLALRSGPRIVSPLANENDPRLEELLAEYRQRSDELRALPAPGLVPSLLLKLSDEIGNVLVVDLGKGRAYLIDNSESGQYVVRNLYAGIGRRGFGKRSEGDLRTPVGIYRINGWMADEQLPPLYGAGALPLSYPNAWDRSLGRTGSGIWLHGVPTDTYVRAPRSSEGCVTFSNNDLLSLRSQLKRGSTPVILAEQLDWVPAEQLSAVREPLLAAIEAWRSRGSALETEAYLSAYADDFRTDDGSSKQAFSEYTRQANAGKRHVEITLSDLSLFAYPGESGLMIAQFIQNDAGDNGATSTSTSKDQFWRQQDDGSWKIVRELKR